MTTIEAPVRPRFGRAAVHALRSTARPSKPVPGSWGTAQITLVVLVSLLNLIGLAMVLSASSVSSLYEDLDTWHYFTRQAIWLGIGVAVLAFTRAVDYRRWQRLAPLGVGVMFLSLALVLVPGVGVVAGGARRWIAVGGFTIQPTELMKMVIILYSADILARRSNQLDDWKQTLGPPVLVFAAASAFVMRQPDLGTVLITGVILLGVLLIGGVRLAPLGILTTLGALAGLVLGLSASYRRARLFAFLDPWADPDKNGYQNIQSLVGIANGGLGGVGIGEGRAKWGFLPEAHTDFIYTVVAEETGFIGAVVILGMFVLLATMGVRIALRAPDRFGTLFAMGMVIWLVFQALVNIGAVVGVLPITGVPLPFVSAGGTSLVASMAAVGILLNIGRQGAS